MKRDNLKNGRKYLQIINLIRGLYSKYIKNSYNSTAKKPSHLIFFKWAEAVTRHSSEEDIHTANRCMKKVFSLSNHQGNASQHHGDTTSRLLE